jgi:hypothetical protein
MRIDNGRHALASGEAPGGDPTDPTDETAT